MKKPEHTCDDHTTAVASAISRRRTYRYVLHSIEDAVLSHISDYCPKMTPPVNTTLDSLAPSYLIASGEFALGWHGIIKDYSSVDISFTHTSAAESFMESDRERAHRAGIMDRSKHSGLVYSWYVDPSKPAVYSFAPGVEHNMSGLIQINFAGPGCLPSVVLRRPRMSDPVYSLAELFGRYSWLIENGPIEHRDKNKAYLETVSAVMCKNYTEMFEPFAWPTTPHTR